MKPDRRWPWQETLALAREGRWVEVQEIVPGSVHRQCERLEIRKGAVLRCVSRDPEFVVLEDEKGNTRQLQRPFAWFVGTAAEPGREVGVAEETPDLIPEMKLLIETETERAHD